MKTLYTWILITALACSVHAQNAQTEYLWMDTQGRTLTADFVNLDGNIVTLRANDRLFTVALDKLSAQSVKQARELEAKQDRPGLNAAVLAYCRTQIGNRVGNGQCTSLASSALDHAGAAGIIRDFPAAGDYVWGNLVTVVAAERAGVTGIPTLAQVRGGDIIQMRNVSLAGRSPAGGTYSMRADHHTAVVEAVNPTQGTITVLHQNWGRKIVRRDTFILGDLKSGWMRIYRPVARR